MTKTQSSTLTPRAVAHPRCPRCQTPSLVQRATAGRPGFEHWTLKCIRCGHIHEAQLTDYRRLSFTFANADGTLVAIPEDVVRVMETLPDSGELHERINLAARIAADRR